MSNSEEKTTLDVDKNAKKGNFATKKGEVVLREHAFDGIQEYDQRLPNWWLVVLWLSIGFFVVYYLVYYSFALLPTSTAMMDEREKAIYAEQKAAIKKTLDSLSDDILVNKWASDPKIVASGKAVYQANCVACHGVDYLSNGGATARPLIDGIWEHGDKPMDVFNMVLNGTPAGKEGYRGMTMLPKGGSTIGPQQIAEVTAFLISLNPKDFEVFKK